MVQERQEPAEVGLLLDAGHKMPAREGFAEALRAPAKNSEIPNLREI